MIWKLLSFLGLFSMTICAQTDSAFFNVDAEIWSVPLKQIKLIKINGLPIDSTDNHVSIPINTSGFDTIVFQVSDVEKKSIMKLRPGNTYLLRANYCSFYTLSSAQDHRRGLVKFKIEEPKGRVYRAGNDITATLYVNKKDKYYYYPHSAMCGDASQQLQIQNEKYEELSSIYFHFLHGEKLLYTFNEETGDMSLRLMGFINKDKQYKVKYDKQ